MLSMEGSLSQMMMWSAPSELGCVKRTRNGTSQAYMPSFQTGTMLYNCMESSEKIIIYKLRFNQHYVLFSRLLNKYLMRKKCAVLLFGHHWYLLENFARVLFRLSYGDLIPKFLSVLSGQIILIHAEISKHSIMIVVTIHVTVEQHIKMFKGKSMFACLLPHVPFTLLQLRRWGWETVC